MARLDCTFSVNFNIASLIPKAKYWKWNSHSRKMISEPLRSPASRNSPRLHKLIYRSRFLMRESCRLKKRRELKAKKGGRGWRTQDSFVIRFILIVFRRSLLESFLCLDIFNPQRIVMKQCYRFSGCCNSEKYQKRGRMVRQNEK